MLCPTCKRRPSERYTPFQPPDIPDERARLKAAMQLTGGNLSAAARHLGMKRSTLHDRLQRHGIRRVVHS